MIALTLSTALDAARQAVTGSGTTHVIYRLPDWPDGMYAVVAEARGGLPPHAQLAATLTADGLRPVVGQQALF